MYRAKKDVFTRFFDVFVMFQRFFREFRKNLIRCWYPAVATVLQVLATLSAGKRKFYRSRHILLRLTVNNCECAVAEGTIKIGAYGISDLMKRCSQLTCKDNLTSKVKFRI